MDQSAENDTSVMGDQVRFKTTQWNIVQCSKDAAALDYLIRTYWKPLYFFVRQRGVDNESAKDLVQSFLTSFLERKAFGKADPSRGRFRTYLLSCFENFLRDQNRAARSRKRTGGADLLCVDFTRGELDYQMSRARQESPVLAINRAWARSLWEQSLSELHADPRHLKAFELYRAHEDLRTISKKTGLSVSAAQSAISRLRRQLREILVRHIRGTVSSEEDLRAELHEFVNLLS